MAFSGKNRILGVAAKNQLVTNMKNTIFGFKRLLGRKSNDPHVQRELQQIPYRTSVKSDGRLGIKVKSKANTKYVTILHVLLRDDYHDKI